MTLAVMILFIIEGLPLYNKLNSKRVDQNFKNNDENQQKMTEKLQNSTCVKNDGELV
jgi:hypothetical protein